MAEQARPVEEQIHRLLIRLHVAVKQYEDGLIARFGVSRRQAQALYRIDPGETVPLGVLADRVYSDPSNLARTLDALAKLGLVERGSAAHDGRVRVVSLTTKGEALRAKLLAAHLERHPASAPLSKEDRQRLRDLLEKLDL